MDVKIYMYNVMFTIIPTKELNFIVNDFLYMYCLISKYVVVGGGVHLATNYYENSIPKICKN